MPRGQRKHRICAPEFRQQLVEPVRAGRTPESCRASLNRPGKRSATGCARRTVIAALGVMA